MKAIISFLIILNFNFAISQNNEENIILKNKVKEQKVYDANQKLSEISKFNTNGKLIFNQKDNFTSSTYLKTSKTIKYNEQGLIIEEKTTHSSFPEPSIRKNEYDENGNLIKIYSDKNRLILKNFFNERNKIILAEMFDDDEKMIQTTEYNYFDNDTKVESIINGDFLKNRKIIEYYDNQNREIKSEGYQNDKIYFTSIKTYKNNKLVKEIYDEGENIHGDNYYYDEKGNLIKRELFDIENGIETSNSSENFEYSENGLLKTYSENFYSADSKTRKYRYEYTF
jgi:hypothetical protein